MGALLLDPHLGEVAVPSPHPAGSFGTNPGVQAEGPIELDGPVGLGEALFDIPLLLLVDHHQVGIGEFLRSGEGGAGLDGLLHVEDEGALLPVHLDELESVLGHLLGVGDHKSAALHALEVGHAGKRGRAVQLVPTDGHALLQFGVVVAKDATNAGHLPGLGGVHAEDLGVRIRRGEEAGEEHARQLHVQRVQGGAGGLLDPVVAAHAAPADDSVLLQGIGVGHLVVGGVEHALLLVHLLRLVATHGPHLPGHRRLRRPAVPQPPPGWP